MQYAVPGIDGDGRDEIAIPARITGGRGEDVVVVTHNSGKILIFSAA